MTSASGAETAPAQTREATGWFAVLVASGILASRIAGFVRQHSDRFAGWCSVDPNDPACVEQLEHCVKHLGLKGLKLGPIYQNFDPQDPRHLPLFKKAEQLGIPINWHQGTSFVRTGPLKYSNPILLEDIAVAINKVRWVMKNGQILIDKTTR